MRGNPVYIKKLSIKNFRNYADEELEFASGVNLLVGENGQGKTNLLEAIGFLPAAKSFRMRREQELVRAGEESFSVRGEFEKRGGEQLVVEIHWRADEAKRRYFVNGAEKSTVADLLGGVYAIVFSPEDLALVKGSPGERRRFLDRELILLRPLYYRKLKKYRSLLGSRNALLKAENPSGELLEVYDEQLASAGAEVIVEREKYIKALAEESAESVSLISDGKEKLKLEYRSNLKDCEDFSNEQLVEEHFLKELKRTRERDLFLRATGIGPHRDDIFLSLGGADLRVYGSQGQQRTAALSLRLAERVLIKKEIGEDAILLLDDVMSELDAGRQKRILSVFSENQVFVTAAETGAFTESAQVFAVQNGRCVRA